MSTPPRLRLVVALVAVAAAVVGASQLPRVGAGALLHPSRRAAAVRAPDGCDETTFSGAGISLEGWRCGASAPRRATLIYLHGVADNRTSAAGIVRRFRPRGFDVIAYDSRAHGKSGGDACTYGFLERHDLRTVIDDLDGGPVVLLGTSLGAAVALQAAAEDPRVAAVVAAETFSDLRSIANDRVPFLVPGAFLARAFEHAERLGAFSVDAVSPVDAARRIRVPVLLVHGGADADTPLEHSRRVYAALAGPKRLVIVPGAGHTQALAGHVWPEVEDSIDQALTNGASLASNAME